MMKKVKFIGFAILFILLFSGCETHPKITVENIYNDIIGKSLGEFSWRFKQDEPKKISIIENKYNGDKASIVVNIKTYANHGYGFYEYRSGKLRLNYEWIAKEWNMVSIDNLSFGQHHSSFKAFKRDW